MSQTSYSRSFSAAFSGQLGDTGPKRSGTYVASEGADLPAGIFVSLQSESAYAKKAELPDAISAKIVGVSMHSVARDPGTGSTVLSGAAAIKDGAAFNVMEEGAVFMLAEQTMAAGDDCFCRMTSDGASNTVIGRLRKDADTSAGVDRAFRVKGARVLLGAAAGECVLVYFSASVQNAMQKEDTTEFQIALSAAAEAGNAIVVTGAVKDQNGNALTAAVDVLVRTLAVTDNLGDITVTAGTSKKVVNPATGENVAWIRTTSAGAFAFSVADSAVEDVLVQVTSDKALAATLTLTFA